MARVSIVISLVALAVAGSTSAAPPEPLNVLFVGNSLTQANDLPAQVARLATATGRSLEYKTVAFGGFNLEDHWNQGDARTALATGDYDVLVMQQGPSALPESQVDLKLWAGRWADEARAAGTRGPRSGRYGPSPGGRVRSPMSSTRTGRLPWRPARTSTRPEQRGSLPGNVGLRSGSTVRTASTRARSARTRRRSSSTGDCSRRRSASRR